VASGRDVGRLCGGWAGGVDKEKEWMVIYEESGERLTVQREETKKKVRKGPDPWVFNSTSKKKENVERNT